VRAGWRQQACGYEHQQDRCDTAHLDETSPVLPPPPPPPRVMPQHRYHCCCCGCCSCSQFSAARRNFTVERQTRDVAA